MQVRQGDVKAKGLAVPVVLRTSAGETHNANEQGEKLNMKHRFLIPTVGLCMASALLTSPLRADQTRTIYDQKNPINVSQVLHARVLDQSGQKIGDVEDIVVDPNTGRAQFAVIKLSGDLADRGKYTPVPFSLLKFSDTDKKDVFGHRDLTLRADREKLLSGSRFSAKTWPDQDHPTWGSDAYAHYGGPWDSSVERGGTGASFNSSTGGDSTVVVTETSPRAYTVYEYREGRPYSDKPIDNGTGPDGKDTFRFFPRPWPYHDVTDAH